MIIVNRYLINFAIKIIDKNFLMSENSIPTEAVPRAAVIVMAILAFFGAIKVLFVLWRLLSFVYRHFIRKGYHLHTRYYGTDTWALITGGTDGLGL